MAVQLVTGQTGDLNVTSENQGAFNAAVVGGGQYVMTGCECKMASATKLHVGPGVLCVNGRNVHIDKQGADVAIEAGATGKNRNDVVCVRYKRAGSAQDMRESVELVVVKGTPVAGEAKDPAYTSGSVLDGAAVVDMPLCRVPIKGIVPGTPEMMSPTVPSLAEMWDSVSRRSGTLALSAGCAAATAEAPFWVSRGATLALFGRVRVTAVNAAICSLAGLVDACEHSAQSNRSHAAVGITAVGSEPTAVWVDADGTLRATRADYAAIDLSGLRFVAA